MMHVSFVRWAKEIPGGDYDAPVDPGEVGSRTVDQYLPEGVTLKTSFPDMKTVRKVLNSIRPDEAGIYPVLAHLEISLPDATPYRPPTEKTKTEPASKPLSWWRKILQSFGFR